MLLIRQTSLVSSMYEIRREYLESSLSKIIAILRNLHSFRVCFQIFSTRFECSVTSSTLVSSVVLPVRVFFGPAIQTVVGNVYLSTDKPSDISCKTTLETSGEDVKITLETGGEDAKIRVEKMYLYASLDFQQPLDKVSTTSNIEPKNISSLLFSSVFSNVAHSFRVCL
jgi:hypothetical protein